MSSKASAGTKAPSRKKRTAVVLSPDEAGTNHVRRAPARKRRHTLHAVLGDYTVEEGPRDKLSATGALSKPAAALTEYPGQIATQLGGPAVDEDDAGVTRPNVFVPCFVFDVCLFTKVKLLSVREKRALFLAMRAEPILTADSFMPVFGMTASQFSTGYIIYNEQQRNKNAAHARAGSSGAGGLAAIAADSASVVTTDTAFGTGMSIEEAEEGE
jgi:hypothetical protein